MMNWIKFPRTALWHSYPLLTRRKEETLLLGAQRRTRTNPQFAASVWTEVNHSCPSCSQLRYLFSCVCCITFYYILFLSPVRWLLPTPLSVVYALEDKLYGEASQLGRADLSLGILIPSHVCFTEGLWGPWVVLLPFSSVLYKPRNSSVLPNHLHRPLFSVLKCWLTW